MWVGLQDNHILVKHLRGEGARSASVCIEGGGNMDTLHSDRDREENNIIYI